jgi:hypothetical protein
MIECRFSATNDKNDISDDVDMSDDVSDNLSDNRDSDRPARPEQPGQFDVPGNPGYGESV